MDAVMVPVTIVNTDTAHQELVALVEADDSVPSSQLDRLRYAKAIDIVKGILYLDELVIMHLFDTVTFPYMHEAAMTQHVEMASSPVFPLNTSPELSVDSATASSGSIDDSCEETPDSHLIDLLTRQGRFVRLTPQKEKADGASCFYIRTSPFSFLQMYVSKGVRELATSCDAGRVRLRLRPNNDGQPCNGPTAAVRHFVGRWDMHIEGPQGTATLKWHSHWMRMC